MLRLIKVNWFWLFFLDFAINLLCVCVFPHLIEKLLFEQHLGCLNFCATVMEDDHLLSVLSSFPWLWHFDLLSLPLVHFFLLNLCLPLWVCVCVCPYILFSGMIFRELNENIPYRHTLSLFLINTCLFTTRSKKTDRHDVNSSYWESLVIKTNAFLSLFRLPNLHHQHHFQDLKWLRNFS